MESDDSDALLIDAGEDELSLDAEELQEAEAILGSKAGADTGSKTEAARGSTDRLWNTANAAIIGAYTADTSATSRTSPPTSGEGAARAPGTEGPRPEEPSGDPVTLGEAAKPPPVSTFTFGKALQPPPAARSPPASTFSGASFRSLPSLSPSHLQVLRLRPALPDGRHGPTSCGGACSTATCRALQVRSGHGEALPRGEATRRDRRPPGPGGAAEGPPARHQRHQEDDPRPIRGPGLHPAAPHLPSPPAAARSPGARGHGGAPANNAGGGAQGGGEEAGGGEEGAGPGEEQDRRGEEAS